MAGTPRWHPLLALPTLVAAGQPAAGGSERVVGALLGVLLCLAAGLALAWHHLCRVSAGWYHPCPMGRRALALLQGRWHRLWGQRWGGGSPEDHGEVAAEVAARGHEEEEELMPWCVDTRPEKDDEDEEKEEDEEEEEDEEATEDPPSGAGGQQAVGGSAEALLSDLHAFSGTAAWGDPRASVTAL